MVVYQPLIEAARLYGRMDAPAASSSDHIVGADIISAADRSQTRPSLGEPLAVSLSHIVPRYH